MRDWLASALSSMTLSSEAEGYVLGRGLSPRRIADLGVVQWDSSVITAPPPDRSFTESHGNKGFRWNERICIPIWSPRGILLGCEVRAWFGEKRVSQYLLPESNWNPVFIGMRPDVMARIWGGSDVWLVEGVFDLSALDHVVHTSAVVLATLRARVSPNHVTFFARYASGIVNIAYDNDETGQNQTYGFVDPESKRSRTGAVDFLRRAGVRARGVTYRGGKDPGQIWDSGGVPALRRAFKSYLNNVNGEQDGEAVSR